MSRRFSWRVLKKEIHQASVLVFDLDDTLYLHNGHNDSYHNKMKEYLEQLSKCRKILCVATHNGNPEILLDKMNIKHLFEYIVFETKSLNSYLHSIRDYTNKKDMISEIIQKTKCRIKDIVFFDDNLYNIIEVESMNVKCVFVPKTGLALNLLM